MRLTHLKLAGFKSFVDSTTVHLHGQRVGVVGPNGCGKSNVMESVRWVLGESSSKELRADGMDAIIFNGSSNRKPISRASVELIFDNSLGGANGEWSQYAEISVKRVIEREKGSTYYINNTVVRRRDVADLFLGTGLGGRAYAIIGQNTISRIVEAKPEELRIFLEEAAGISKYKDRRRETELRLRDTRENLTRVEDICLELQKQITRLESQATITQKYHVLQDELKLTQGQLWLLKKRDTSSHWEKSKAKVEKLANQLEEKIADLRKTESHLEISRQDFYNATEAINVAQAAYYGANAEVVSLENQVKQNAEARERMAKQLTQIAHDLEGNQTANNESHKKLTEVDAALTIAKNAEQSAQTGLSKLAMVLPEKEAMLNSALEKAQKSQRALYEANQHVEIENNNIQYLQQTVDENDQRVERLEADLANLTFVDKTQMTQTETDFSEAQRKIIGLESRIQKYRSDENALQTNISTLREVENQAQREVDQAEGEISSLVKIQQSLNTGNQLSAWLEDAGLATSQRLWQKVKIDEAWSVALEAVLGEKLNAVISDGNQLTKRPPSTFALGFAGVKTKARTLNRSLTPLFSVMKSYAPELKAMLEDWLAGTYLLDADDDVNVKLKDLNAGEFLVNKQGDVFDHHGVTYHGENSSLHGVIERQQRLDTVRLQLPDLQQKLSASMQKLDKAEHGLQEVRRIQQQESITLKSVTESLHHQQLTLSKLQQSHEAAVAREKGIKMEIEVAKNKYTQYLADLVAKKTTIKTITSNTNTLVDSEKVDVLLKVKAEKDYQTLRDTIVQAEREHQESTFNFKLIFNNINDLNNKINVIYEEKESLLQKQSDAEKTLMLTPMETLKINLTNAVNAKQEKEGALVVARNKTAELELQLQGFDRVRLQNEQQLDPARDDLEKSRLSEQEARLYFEQCQAQLKENRFDEQVLSESLNEDAKAGTFLTKTNQLEQQIQNLGAVNLAAIEELASEAERKGYLDSQVLDLYQASETLEAAINKIDKETRDKLLTTFNEANGHFGELFSTLFGGGQAKLELLGEEILDTGLQVFAQPPGKKNTTIQLLSGGEKALTALALVFALFRLNPAPFCLMDEVDAPLDDSNTERFCAMVKKMSENTQFLFVSHNKITMEIAQQLIGVTMQESGVSRIVDVDMEAALQMHA